MAMIDKKTIHYRFFADFNAKKLSANAENTTYTVGISGETIIGEPDIKYASIVFIRDTRQIWTHGSLYEGLDKVGELSGLTTSAQSSVVDAINEVNSKVDSIEVLTISSAVTVASGETYTIYPNIFYNFGTVSELTLELGEGQEGYLNEYIFQFESADVATTLSLPEGITWYLDNNTILANKTYQISIVNDLAILGEF